MCKTTELRRTLKKYFQSAMRLIEWGAERWNFESSRGQTLAGVRGKH